MRLMPFCESPVEGAAFLVGCGASAPEASAAAGTLDGAATAAEAAAPFRNVRRSTPVVMGINLSKIYRHLGSVRSDNRVEMSAFLPRGNPSDPGRKMQLV